MKVGYIGGGWVTNIGNSFYNLGTLWMLKHLFSSSDVFLIPDIAKWIWDVEDNFEPLEHTRMDVCVTSGPILSRGILNYRRIFQSFRKRNIQVAFVSAGAWEYTQEELKMVSAFLTDFKDIILCIATRDSQTHEMFTSVGIKMYDGICGSMFLNDAVHVPEFISNEYIVLNFPKKNEPLIEFKGDDVVISPRTNSRAYPDQIGGFPVVRTNSRSFSKDKERTFDLPNMFASDLPDGYLAIYKNARCVFSERVHTCAATLILGGRAMFIPVSKVATDGRYHLLRRIGADNVFSKPTSLNFPFIQQEKESLLEFCRTSIGKQ